MKTVTADDIVLALQFARKAAVRNPATWYPHLLAGYVLRNWSNPDAAKVAVEFVDSARGEFVRRNPGANHMAKSNRAEIFDIAISMARNYGSRSVPTAEDAAEAVCMVEDVT